MDPKLTSKVKRALKAYEKGTPLKDYLDDSDIVKALRLLMVYHNHIQTRLK